MDFVLIISHLNLVVFTTMTGWIVLIVLKHLLGQVVVSLKLIIPNI
jgi:hypothetical protein